MRSVCAVCASFCACVWVFMRLCRESYESPGCVGAEGTFIGVGELVSVDTGIGAGDVGGGAPSMRCSVDPAYVTPEPDSKYILEGSNLE